MIIEICRSGSFVSYLTTGLRQLVNKSWVPSEFLIAGPVARSGTRREKQHKTKTGFGVEPTGTLLSVPNGFAARGEPRLP